MAPKRPHQVVKTRIGYVFHSYRCEPNQPAVATSECHFVVVNGHYFVGTSLLDQLEAAANIEEALLDRVVHRPLVAFALAGAACRSVTEREAVVVTHHYVTPQ